MMKSGLILIFKMYKMAETGLQLLQAGTDPLISMKSLQSFQQNTAGLITRVDLFHLWSASQLPYIQNQECSWRVAHSRSIKCLSERFLSCFEWEFLTNDFSLVLGHSFIASSLLFSIFSSIIVFLLCYCSWSHSPGFLSFSWRWYLVVHCWLLTCSSHPVFQVVVWILTISIIFTETY